MGGGGGGITWEIDEIRSAIGCIVISSKIKLQLKNLEGKRFLNPQICTFHIGSNFHRTIKSLK